MAHAAAVELLLRWLHVLGGIVWLGLLYFLAFVYFPAIAEADGTDREPGRAFLPRTLAWMSRASMLSIASGLALFATIYMYTPGLGWGPTPLWSGMDGGVSHRALWNATGIALAFVSAFNVWFVILPVYRKIAAGGLEKQDEIALRKRAALAIQANVFLSGPLLIAMLAASHLGVFEADYVIGAVIVGYTAAYVALKLTRARRIGK